VVGKLTELFQSICQNWLVNSSQYACGFGWLRMWSFSILAGLFLKLVGQFKKKAGQFIESAQPF
jgi:hypothetical protein